MDIRNSDWKKELQQDLEKVERYFSVDQHPANLETQREYGQTLNELERRYSDRLDDFFAGERAQFDRGFRNSMLRELDQEERARLAATRDPEMQMAIREGQRGERMALARGDYRDSEEYKEQMQELVERQADDRERADQAFRTVEDSLNERFRLSRERDNYDRER
ncbi:MAG: hypothetical protein KF743_13195 [Fimbriimonadaceae bacterium]|nr:hypothetical protein [Fimbriimonadaceae bacterium]